MPGGRGAAAETIAAIVAGLVERDGSTGIGMLLERSIPLLGARAAYLCVPEDPPGAGAAVVPRQLRVSAQRGFSEAFVAELGRGEERAGQLAIAAARTLEPQWIEQEGAGAGPDRRLLASAQARSLLAVPLVARGILHGVLVWAFDTEVGGDPETLRLARATAGAAALGLASASAEAEHEELLLLATVCRAERAVLRRTTPESVARSALRWSLALAHADAAAIHLDGGEPGWRLAGTEPACRRLSAVLETGAVKDRPRPWLLPGGGVAARGGPVDPGPPLELLAIPLRRSGRLVLARSAARPLPESVARALETFARTAAAALAHAQALQQLEHEAAERARTEAAARAGEAELSDRFERIPEAVLVVDGAQRVLDANRAACELLGAPKAALHGHRLEEIEAIGVRLPAAAALSAAAGQGPPALPELESAAGERLQPDEQPLCKALGGEQVGPVELAVRCAGGAARPVHLRAAPILGVGASTAAVVVLEDISAQKHVEQLRQEWTSVVTHELLQALTTLNLYAGILQRPASGLSPDALGRLEHVVASSRRIHRIVRDLHDATRIDGRRLEVELGPADLGALLPAAIERARPLTDPVPVELAVDGRLPVVRADPERVEQVLSNLLVNAAKYGREGSPVRVGARCADGVVEVTVTNEGEGIPSGEQARIFERFSRTALGRRARKTGLGLGLYICRGIVEAHGGRIGVESTPGATTTFRFTLPTAPARSV